MADPETLRHSASHVLAAATKLLFPDVKLGIGPAIEDGFYYDFDKKTPFTPEDLVKIEKAMQHIVKQNLKFEKMEVSFDEAKKLLKDEPYKLELLEELKSKGEKITFYKSGELIDLCKGPHVESTGKIKALKLTKMSSAYWKGNEKNPSMQRIYGVAFETKDELDNFVKLKEEAEKRDHNKVGRELELFTTNDSVGQGLPLIMPKGAKIIQILQRFIEDEEEKRGYQLTKTPYMAKSDLYKISGHWDHYKDNMFIVPGKDGEVLALRPMTCPFQFMIYKARSRSYKELPVRFSETSTLFRNEASGEMHGLIRVRQFTLSDAHIICMPEQLEHEFKKVLDLVQFVMKTLGIDKEIWYRFSKWDPKNKEKYIDNPKAWEESQKMLKKILDDIGLKYTEADGEAAFYGPKLDIQFRNVYGKEDTIITLQIDFALPERFEMTYVDKDNSKKTPMVIHRSSIGCYERTLAMLIEHYAGKFPLWLSPVQVKVVTVNDRNIDFAREIVSKLISEGLRVELDDASETIAKKVRNAQLEKVNYILTIGDKEQEAKTLAVRTREGKVEFGVNVEKFVSDLKKEIEQRR